MQGYGWSFAVLLAAGCGQDSSEQSTPNTGRGGNGAEGGNAGQQGGGSESGGTDGGSVGTPVRDPLPCFADDGTPAGDAIRLTIATNRQSGVAPLAVFFDTEGTTAEATDRPYHELGYCWDFGDPDAGNFATTGLSKNQAKGPLAGHVFETPGTYTVAVSARDAAGRVSSLEVSVDVEDPDSVFAGENTVCFSGTADFEGCPAGALQVEGDSLSDIQPEVASGRRLLLHRGETFQGDSTLNINVPGPGTIGAYGEGDRPSILPLAEAYPDTEPVLHLSDDEAADFSDWRLMDVAIDEPSFAGKVAIAPSGNAVDFLMLRVLIHGMAAGINAGIDAVDYWVNEGYPADIFDGMFLQDCELREITSYALYVATRRLLYLGNVLTDSRSEPRNSLMRLHWLDRAVIGNNQLGPGECTDSHLLYIPGPYFTQQPGTQPSLGNGQYGRRILVSDNVFEPGTLLNWSFYLGAQNTGSDERFRDVLIERNLFLAGGEAHQASLAIRGDVHDATVRDNLFRQPRGVCVTLHGWVHRDTPTDEFVPTNLALVHNTCVLPEGPLVYLDNTSPAVGVEYESITLANNLIVGGAVLKQGGGAPMIDSDLGNVLAASGLATPEPTSWADFMPAADGDAIDGADPSVWSPWDFSGAARPAEGADSGALEYSAE